MNDNIKNKLKTKIAISKLLDEEKLYMKDRKRFIIKYTSIAACLIIALSTVTFAGNKIIEKIWSNPKLIKNPTSEITEEAKKENISEEEAKKIAINKLKEVGFSTNIIETDHYKEIDSNTIMYRFITDDNYQISIDGLTGEFFDIWNHNDIQDINKKISKDEALEAAKKYIKLLGYNLDDYMLTNVIVNNNDRDEVYGEKIDFDFCKKYGDTYNPYEYIGIGIESKNKDFSYIRVANKPFDNNEVKISKEDAINIALEIDKKIATNKVISTKAEKMIVKMNADAYDRINNYEDYYKKVQTPGYPTQDRNYYLVEEKIRNAWVIVITYEDTFGDDISKRYTEGMYSYFVDCTTGEIIGGDSMDYTASR